MQWGFKDSIDKCTSLLKCMSEKLGLEEFVVENGCCKVFHKSDGPDVFYHGQTLYLQSLGEDGCIHQMKKLWGAKDWVECMPPSIRQNVSMQE
jgi:hypothetical protein